MELEKYKTQAAKLYGWIHGDGEAGRIFFINGYVGHKISTNGGKLILTEGEGGHSNYPGDVIELDHEDIETMEYDADEYRFSIVTKGEGYDIEGYDIEVYTLERVYLEE